MPDIALRKTILTEDGSSTLKLLCYDEQFHSLHGAIAEAECIYINAGLRALPDNLDEIHILEMGLGTGLNALLTLQHNLRDVNHSGSSDITNFAAKNTIYYHAIEAFPLTPEEVQSLNYVALINPALDEAFQAIHNAPTEEWTTIMPNFFFKKSLSRLEDIFLEENRYNLLYFDAFSPDIQPELWSETIFKKCYKAMTHNAILVTYCAKGQVKRAFRSVGFELFSLPGPVGKREISRCLKP
jgi:tRNA U34 5-methylaminomethyl-2-thiouridine-forming methyltransferase MnmC